MGIPDIRAQDWHVLQLVHRLGSTPQHKLAEHMGRQRSTVNGAVQRLIGAGWLRPVGQASGGRGRPAILLAVERQVGCFAGLDITADEVHCTVVAADGTLLDQVSSRHSADRTLPAVLDLVDLTLRGLMSRVGVETDRLLGLWAGVNGAVDDRGVVVSCASLGWYNEPLRASLKDRYRANTLVQGGATVMGAAAEWLMGAGRDAESLAYYHAGRGISTRLIHRGQPLTGATQRAGELGHVVVEPGGAQCACGNNGCLEAVASGPAIVAAIRKLPQQELPEPVRQALRQANGSTTADIAQAAFEHGGDRAKGSLGNLLQRVTNHLAMGAAMVVAAYDPEVLVLGGYLFADNAALREDVRGTLEKMVLDWDKRALRVVESEVVTQGRALGGAAEVCQRFWANPRGVVTA